MKVLDQNQIKPKLKYFRERNAKKLNIIFKL